MKEADPNLTLKHISGNPIGLTVGKLTVTGVENGCTPSRSRWILRCCCGREVKRTPYDLLVRRKSKLGIPASCGCVLYCALRQHNLGPRGSNYQHGRSHTSIHGIWTNMIMRCHNQRATSFIHYGARGIRVCERWRESFDNFLKDVGERPSKRHSLDRINNNGDYEPGNVRWATASEQARNSSTALHLLVDGKKMCLREALSHLRVSHCSFYSRRKKGMSAEDAIQSLQLMVSKRHTKHRG